MKIFTDEITVAKTRPIGRITIRWKRINRLEGHFRWNGVARRFELELNPSNSTVKIFTAASKQKGLVYSTVKVHR